MRITFRFRKGAAALALLGVLATVGVTGFRKAPVVFSKEIATPKIVVKTSNSRPVFVAPAVATDLLNAMKLGSLEIAFHGNGRNIFTIVAHNVTTKPLHVTAPGGLAFQSGRNVMVTLRPTEFTVAPGQKVEQPLAAAALSTSNLLAELDYSFTNLDLSRYQALLDYFAAHDEVSTPAAQTALLALSENLPLRAVSKFSCKGADLATRFDTTPFKVDTVDIVRALLVLHAIGVSNDELAMTVDPQLRIEAMIDPLSHALAMRYYGITPTTEWDYWKNELTKGDPGTRHYALYGIARFFPNVALEMLPRWARETKTSPILRMAAVQALTETQRPEALSVLRSLAYDLGGDKTELGKTARLAAEYVDGRVSPTAAKDEVVFRGTMALGMR